MNIINELETLAIDMVCGKDQETVFKRIEVIKQLVMGKRKRLKWIIFIVTVFICSIIVSILLLRVFNTF